MVVALAAGLAACGEVPAPTAPRSLDPPAPAPTPTPVAQCSAWPDGVFIDSDIPAPATDQVTACREDDFRPEIRDVAAFPWLAGAGVEATIFDLDRETVCHSIYFNGRGAVGCGGRGRIGHWVNNLTFPVHVRVVAWDSHGCLAEPICLSVPPAAGPAR